MVQRTQFSSGITRLKDVAILLAYKRNRANQTSQCNSVFIDAKLRSDAIKLFKVAPKATSSAVDCVYSNV